MRVFARSRRRNPGGSGLRQQAGTASSRVRRRRTSRSCCRGLRRFASSPDPPQPHASGASILAPTGWRPTSSLPDRPEGPTGSLPRLVHCGGQSNERPPRRFPGSFRSACPTRPAISSYVKPISTRAMIAARSRASASRGHVRSARPPAGQSPVRVGTRRCPSRRHRFSAASP